MRKRSLVIRYKSGAYGIYIEWRKDQWNFLHLCDNWNHMQQWLDTLHINRRYLAYRYY